MFVHGILQVAMLITLRCAVRRGSSRDIPCWFTEFCKSLCLSHFAAPFVVVRAETFIGIDLQRDVCVHLACVHDAGALSKVRGGLEGKRANPSGRGGSCTARTQFAASHASNRLGRPLGISRLHKIAKDSL